MWLIVVLRLLGAAGRRAQAGLLGRRPADSFAVETLAAAVATVLVTRSFLELSEYPQLGNEALHVAHVMWGGLLMLVAGRLGLAFYGAGVRRASALLLGAGFGLFIDEIGKFVTRDYDYFFRPAASLIYASFVLLYVTARVTQRLAPTGERALLLYGIEGLEEAARGALRPERKAASVDALERVAGSGSPHAGLARQLCHVLAEQVTVQPPTGWLPRRLAAVRSRWASSPRFRAWLLRVVVLFTVFGVLNVAGSTVGLALVSAAVITRGLVLGPDFTVAILHTTGSVVAGAYFARGLWVLRRDPDAGLARIGTGFAVTLLVVDVFTFYFHQFGAATGALTSLLLLRAVRALRSSIRVPSAPAAQRAERATTMPGGLSETEVLARRARGEGNHVPPATGRSYAEILRENVFTVVNVILFSLGAALLALGRPSDALVSVGVGAVNMLVGVAQEVRAKRALDKITLLSRPTATVVRDGSERTVDPAEIVLGDLLLVRPGDQIVVDGAVVDGRVDVDESLLTGESDPIPKGPGDPVYSGSFAVGGKASYEARTVGAAGLAQRLAAGARAFRRVYTPLQWRIERVVRLVVVAVVILEALLFAGALLKAVPLVDTVRNAMVVVGLVPNGLLLAIGLAYAMGAVRLAGRGALVQQPNAVESLSHVDVLFLDKTGTLTTGRMALHGLHPIGVSEAALRRLLGEYAASVSDGAGSRTSDALRAALGGRRRAALQEVPFSSERKWSALSLTASPPHHVAGRTPEPEVYVLGAPEVLSPHLAPAPGAEALASRVAEWSGAGLRVLLLAETAGPEALHDSGGAPRLPDGLVPLGLVALEEELRPEARETLRDFAAAGVRLKIISGDNPRTVLALAAQAGFPAGRGLSGPELDALEQTDPAAFATAVEETAVFGRVTPAQKERLVQALRDRGHYVAMIGDGVNDVLSLKRADLGIAMQSGSQATRAVADLILLNDSFAVLPHAFREGQRIVGGMRRILRLFLTRVLYVALLILAVAAIQGAFPLGPKQSGLLSLFAVGIPTVALAAWARPVASPTTGLLRSTLRFAVPAAFSLAVTGVAVYLAYLMPDPQAAQR